MNKKIHLVYIDDNIANSLSRYLDNLIIDDIEITTSEVTFNSTEDNYISLMEQENVKLADIIIIDSKLFENQKVEDKFSGEEFKMIYTTVNPYSKVIVISQNEGLEQYGTIKKLDPKLYKNDPRKFYDSNLRTTIEENCKEILQKRNILEILENNSENYKDSYIIEKIKELMQGTSSYKELTDEKINSFIDIIEKSMKSIINEDK